MSAIVGSGLAIATALVAFGLSPFFDAIGLYMAPAALLIPLIGPLIPDRLLYWVVPDGGAPAGVLLITFSTIFFWTLIFGVLYLAWHSRKPRRPMGT